MATAFVRGVVDCYDVDGEGDGWPAAFRAYAADCRKSAAQYRELVALLEREAGLFDRLALVAETGARDTRLTAAALQLEAALQLAEEVSDDHDHDVNNFPSDGSDSTRFALQEYIAARAARRGTDPDSAEVSE